MAGVDAFTWIGLAWIVLVAGALFSIWRSGVHSRKVKSIWSAVAVLVPFLGPASWFLLGRVRRGLRRGKEG